MRSLYSGLISYWNLHEASGDRADLTGFANTLTDTNTVTSSDGLLSNAATFTAANLERLNIASNASIQGGPKNYTFAFWAKLNTKPANAMMLISKYSATAGQAEYEIFWKQATDRFSMNVYRATDSLQQVDADSLGAPALSTWYFIVGWNDNGAPSVNIEINAGTADSTSLSGTTQAASAAALDFGSRGATGTLFLDGFMADVGRWDRLLTRSERLWLYNNGKGRTFPFASGPYGLARHNRSRRLNSGLFIT